MGKFHEAFTRMNPALTNEAPLPAPAEQPPRPEPFVVPEAALPERPRDPRPERAITAAPDSRASLDTIPAVSVRLAAHSPLLPFDGANEMAAERYRSIRTRLRHNSRNLRVICISSSGAGDGKSVNSINIAGAMALRRDNRVLLVDGDFRRSSLASMLGLPNGPGLSEVLAAEVSWTDAIVRIAEAPNLYFMPAGEHKGNPAELLDSPRWRAVCDVFRDRFDFVIVDSPPMGMVTDYELIQTVCDGVILIARQDHSDRSRLMHVIESVPKEKLIGLVINCAAPWLFWKAPEDSPYAYGYIPA